MSAFRMAAPLAAALIALPLLAQAQYDRPIGQPLGTPSYGGPTYGNPTYGNPAYGNQPAGSTAVCESHNGAYRECRVPFSGPPVLTRTLSAVPCVQGQNWGSAGMGAVWVGGGCRAEFADSSGAGNRLPYGQPLDTGSPGVGATVRCESEGGRQRECQLPVQTRLTLLRQISDAPCVEGQSWGSQRNGRVWVRNGCRGDFGPVQGWGGGSSSGWGYGQTVTCESVERRVNYCSWDPRWGRPRVVEKMSQDACQEGRTWGYDGRSQIWVDRGCRARFGN